MSREQVIKITSHSHVYSLVELSSIAKYESKFASCHIDGEINIWSKGVSGEYSHLKELKSVFDRSSSMG